MIAGLTRKHLHSWVAPVRVAEDLHGHRFGYVSELQVRTLPGGEVEAWVDLADVRCAAEWCAAKPKGGERVHEEIEGAPV